MAEQTHLNCRIYIKMYRNGLEKRVLAIMSDGKSHHWAAIARKLGLSYSTAILTLRKLTAEKKLYQNDAGRYLLKGTRRA